MSIEYEVPTNIILGFPDKEPKLLLLLGKRGGPSYTKTLCMLEKFQNLNGVPLFCIRHRRSQHRTVRTKRRVVSKRDGLTNNKTIHTLHSRLVVAVSSTVPAFHGLQPPVEHGRVGRRYGPGPELSGHRYVTVANVQHLRKHNENDCKVAENLGKFV